MRLRSLLQVLVSLAGLAGVVRCAFGPPPLTVGVAMPQPPARAALPSGATGFGCYLVSVTAPGIPSPLRASELASAPPDCLKIGTLSRTVTEQQIRSGVKLSLSAGSARTFRVLGIDPAPGTASDCSDKTLASLFTGSTLPAIYEIGSVTQDLYRNTTVVVPKAYSPAQATNIVGACRPVDKVPRLLTVVGESSGGNVIAHSYVVDASGNLSTASSAPIVLTGFSTAIPRFVATSASADALGFFGINSTNGAFIRLPLRSDFTVSSSDLSSTGMNNGYSWSSLVAAPNGFRYYAGRGTSIQTVTPTTADYGDTTSGPDSFFHLAIHPSGKSLYAMGNGKLWRHAINADGSLSAAGTTSSVPTNLGSPAVSPDGKFLYLPDTSNVEIHVVSLGADESIGTILTQDFSTTFANPLKLVRLHPSGKFVYGVVSSGNSMHVFKRLSDGKLEHAIGAITLLEGSVEEVVVDPAGKRLYTTGGAGGAEFLVYREITESNGDPGSPSTITVHSDFNSLNKLTLQSLPRFK